MQLQVKHLKKCCRQPLNGSSCSELIMIISQIFRFIHTIYKCKHTIVKCHTTDQYTTVLAIMYVLIQPTMATSVVATTARPRVQIVNLNSLS